MAEFLQRSFKKECSPGCLDAGRRYHVSAAITGDVDGAPFHQEIAGDLVVNHDVEKSSSSACDPNHLIAVLLSEMPATRRKRLIEELPERFAAAGCNLPEVSDDLLDAAKSLADRLRVKTTKTVKGPIKTTYVLRVPKSEAA